MKPFDLEAAKRGEPIEANYGKLAGWIGVVPFAVWVFLLWILIP